MSAVPAVLTGQLRPFEHVVAWATIELMKNVAEMAMLRRLAAAALAT